MQHFTEDTLRFMRSILERATVDVLDKGAVERVQLSQKLASQIEMALMSSGLQDVIDGRARFAK